MPLNPSPVTDSMVYPSFSRSFLICLYTLAVSVFVNVHQRFSFVYIFRATTTHQLVHSFLNPKYVASTTKYTARGLCCFFGSGYCSRNDAIVRLSFLYVSASSRMVCLLKTYSFHSCFMNVFFVLLALLKYFPQSLQ